MEMTIDKKTRKIEITIPEGFDVGKDDRGEVLADPYGQLKTVVDAFIICLYQLVTGEVDFKPWPKSGIDLHND